jgi:hypothetical protein
MKGADVRVPNRVLAVLVATVALLLPAGAVCAQPAGPGGVSVNIIGGQDAAEPYPFMVSVQMFTASHWCGGVLVAPSWVLTAEHCNGWFPLSDWKLRIGVLDRMGDGTIARVDRTVDHPTADLTAVHLTVPVTETPVAIAGEAPVGTPLRLLGWGCAVTVGCADGPRMLQQLDTTLIAAGDCVGPRRPDGITTDDICVDNPDNRGSCRGDSGGPALMRGVTGEWLLAGITSDGTQDVCATGPSVYVDMPAAKAWVEDVVANS